MSFRCAAAAPKPLPAPRRLLRLLATLLCAASAMARLPAPRWGPGAPDLDQDQDGPLLGAKLVQPLPPLQDQQHLNQLNQHPNTKATDTNQRNSHLKPHWLQQAGDQQSSFEQLPTACGLREPADDYHQFHAGPLPAQPDPQSLLYIVGGHQVDEEQFWPWAVAVYELDPLSGQRAFICSGSLVSSSFVLTAAHCIQQSRFDTLAAHELHVQIASTRLDDERAHFYRLESVHVHQGYSVDRKVHDIALLRLARGQRLPARARPICLPGLGEQRGDFTGQQVTVIGWGAREPLSGDEQRGRRAAGQLPAELEPAEEEEEQEETGSGSGGANALLAASTPAAPNSGDAHLLQAQVRVTSTQQCDRNYSKLDISWLRIDDHFLCAADPAGRRDACQGDSGGPLMWNSHEAGPLRQASGASPGAHRWFQLGLVSFGHGCANSQFPGVYTRVAYYMPWIAAVVSGRQ